MNEMIITIVAIFVFQIYYVSADNSVVFRCPFDGVDFAARCTPPVITRNVKAHFQASVPQQHPNLEPYQGTNYGYVVRHFIGDGARAK